MNCTHITELLPLYISGDLPSAEMKTIVGHLRSCPDCRSLASEFADDREWLQEAATPALDEKFYADLRAGVWTKIETERAERAERTAPKFWFGLSGLLPSLSELSWRPVTALATATVLLVVIALMANQRGSGPALEIDPPAPLAVALPTPARVPAPSVAPPKKRRPQSKPAPTSAPTTPLIPLPIAPGNRPELGSTAEVTTDGKKIDATSEIEMMRMEIQTADPNIKIIWLTPKETAPKADPFGLTSD